MARMSLGSQVVDTLSKFEPSQGWFAQTESREVNSIGLKQNSRGPCLNWLPIGEGVNKRGLGRNKHSSHPTLAQTIAALPSPLSLVLTSQPHAGRVPRQSEAPIFTSVLCGSG